MLLWSYELNTLGACWLAVDVWSNSSRWRIVRSTWHRRDAYMHNHCLGYRHNFALFYQLPDSNLFTTILIAFKREASSETYGPGVYFPSYLFLIYYFAIFYFQIYKPKNPQKYLLFSLSISIRSHLCKWPWRDWQPLYRVGCKCLIVCVGASIGDLRVSPTGLIPWFLTEVNTYLYCVASPFPLQGKNQRKIKK